MIDRGLNYGRDKIRRFLSSIGSAQGVLDIGAGKGFDLDIARQALPNARLYGLESFPPSIEILRSQGVDVHAVNIERDAFPFPPGSLDVVMANQILEHTKELFWIFHQVSMVLRQYGHLIIGVPNLAALHNRLLLLAGRQPSPIKNWSAHVRGFTRGDLLDFVERAFPGGYRLRAWAGGNFYPFPPLLARPLASLLPSFAWGLFMHLEKVRPYKDEFLRFPIEQKLETNFFVGG